MTPARYKRQSDASRYAKDLAAAFPKSLGLRFDALFHHGLYVVRATDPKGNEYVMTARREHVGSANFLEYAP